MTDRERKKQAPICERTRLAAFLALLALAFALSASLSACGKKPGAVDPPPDVTEDHFPFVYPDPATDPKP